MAEAEVEGRPRRRDNVENNPWDSSPSGRVKQKTPILSTPGDAMSACLALGEELGCAPAEPQNRSKVDTGDNDISMLVMALTRAERAVSNKQVRQKFTPELLNGGFCLVVRWQFSSASPRANSFLETK